MMPFRSWSRRDPYFTRMQASLRDAGVHQPVLVVDRDRLDNNLDRLTADLGPGMNLRIVAKSLASPSLLDRVRERSGSTRLMTFNAIMLTQLLGRYPEADQLLGKPLPVAAAEQVLDQAPQAADHVQWLVDTPQRLAQYASLAEQKGCHLRVNLELDVGLHRGGFAMARELRAALETIRDAPQLTFAGLMGYEPHIAHVPPSAGLRERVAGSTLGAYDAAVALATAVLGPEEIRGATFNTAGSQTFQSYRAGAPSNEVSVGSCLLKPSDFDLPSLAHYEAAVFIATPVLKKLDPLVLPGVDALPWTRLINAAHRARRRGGAGVFIHGGRWLARPVDPPGLTTDPTLASSNQELLSGPVDNVEIDDLVFLRPTQSEAILFQFPEIVVISDGVVVERWEPLPVSA